MCVRVNECVCCVLWVGVRAGIAVPGSQVFNPGPFVRKFRGCICVHLHARVVSALL